MKTLLTAALIALAVPAFAADAPVGKVLKEYTRANPNDPQAQEILGAIESGQIQVQNM